MIAIAELRFCFSNSEHLNRYLSKYSTQTLLTHPIIK